MDSLLRDLRFALRGMGKSPVFNLVTVLTLGLGIGATTLVFSLIQAVLLRPLPYDDPAQLVLVRTGFDEEGLLPTMLSGPEYLEIREQDEIFSEVAAVVEGTFTITGGEEPWQVRALGASPSLFRMLGVEAAVGHTFRPEDEGPGATVAMLSHAFWRSRFGGDRSLVGRTIQVDGEAYRVAGVLPPEFELFSTDEHLPTDVDLWVAMPFDYGQMNRNYRSFRILGRLRPDVSLDTAQARMASLAKALATEYPDSYQDRPWGLELVSLQDHLAEGVRTPLLLLMAAVAGVLLIACGNVVNLLLARAAVRRREMAVRISLGASRRRLVRQLFTEQLLLALLGGVFGVLVAAWGLRTILTLNPERIQRLDEAQLDVVVLLFALGLSLLAALLTGLVPVWRASRQVAAADLREGSRSLMSSLSGRRLHSLLVIAEVALALVVVVGTGLLYRSFQELQSTDPGFRASQLLSMRIDLAPTRYGHRAERSAFFDDLTGRIERLPGVESAGVVSQLPFTDAYWSYPVLAEGRPSRVEEEEFVDLRSVTPGYFETVGAKLVSGRNFQAGDDLTTSHVAILDSNLADRLFPGENPIDQEVRVKETELVRRVIGVVEHINHYGLEEEPKGQIYFAYAQNPRQSGGVVIRAAGDVDPESLVPGIRQQLSAIDADQPAFDIATMQERVASSLGPARFSLGLFSIAAVIAIVLAAVGLYALLSFSVSQRQKEMGVRVALGAERKELLSLVVRQGLRLVAIGLGVGLLTAVAGVRSLESLLYGVPAYDPLTFVTVAVALLLIAFLATLVPALQATRVNPVTALRND